MFPSLGKRVWSKASIWYFGCPIKKSPFVSYTNLACPLSSPFVLCTHTCIHLLCISCIQPLALFGAESEQKNVCRPGNLNQSRPVCLTLNGTDRPMFNGRRRWFGRKSVRAGWMDQSRPGLGLCGTAGDDDSDESACRRGWRMMLTAVGSLAPACVPISYLTWFWFSYISSTRPTICMFHDVNMFKHMSIFHHVKWYLACDVYWSTYAGIHTSVCRKDVRALYIHRLKAVCIGVGHERNRAELISRP
jgi:hypothetical protein